MATTFEDDDDDLTYSKEYRESEADMLLWNENPQEYVRKGYDIAEEYLDPRDAAVLRAAAANWAGP